MKKEKHPPFRVPVRGKTLESRLTKGQRKTWKIIKRGFIELKLAEQGKLQFSPIEKLLNEL